MKKIIKASSLLLLFVLVSSFTKSDVEDVEDVAMCENVARGAYYGVLNHGGSQQRANDAYFEMYWSCVEGGGESDTTTVIE
jgi:hypothetical protein